MPKPEGGFMKNNSTFVPDGGCSLGDNMARHDNPNVLMYLRDLSKKRHEERQREERSSESNPVEIRSFQGDMGIGLELMQEDREESKQPPQIY